jgi:cyclophilin family peptidyl-prolyl cis-trans isomerase
MSASGSQNQTRRNQTRRGIYREFFRHNAVIPFLIFSFLGLSGCHSPTKKQGANPRADQAPPAQEAPTGFAPLASSVFDIETYDNTRVLESGTGFFVTNDLAVSRFSFFTSANRAVIKPFDGENAYEVTGIAGIDRINDLILLKVEGLQRPPVPMTDTIQSTGEPTVLFDRPQANTVFLHKGKVLSYSNVLGSKLYRLSNQLRTKGSGSPVFNSKRRCIGLTFTQVAEYELQTFATPSPFISELIKKANRILPISQLQEQASTKNSEENSKIKGLEIETDMGNIRIKLYNSTPQYRDNFIKLVRENYFDGLLIHRVIKGFGIQSGAADTRFAEADDVVGWKGPGYTLPAHIVPGLYHKRGVIGSPRKPDTENERKRSDGSQFYIVTGRTYTDDELNDLEKENHYRFTTEQRETYKTVGGAPHLDGTYTIFGEVTSGLEVADKISRVEVKKDFRPVNDIRIKKIRILE